MCVHKTWPTNKKDNPVLETAVAVKLLNCALNDVRVSLYTKCEIKIEFYVLAGDVCGGVFFACRLNVDVKVWPGPQRKDRRRTKSPAIDAWTLKNLIVIEWVGEHMRRHKTRRQSKSTEELYHRRVLLQTVSACLNKPHTGLRTLPRATKSVTTLKASHFLSSIYKLF